MGLTVEPYAEALRRGTEAMLACEGVLAPDSPFRDFWYETLEHPLRRHRAVLIARDGDEVCGAALAMRRPVLDGKACEVFFFVPAGREWQGIESALKHGLDAALVGVGVTRQVVTVEGEAPEALACLREVGFVEIERGVKMGWAGQAYAYDAVPGVRCVFYEGGDETVNAEIAALYRRAFRGDPLAPPLEAATVDDLIRIEQSWLLLAEEAETGRIVGFVEASPAGFVHDIAVARSHWGTGLAEYLSGIIMDRYVAEGRTEMWAVSRPRNAASLALQRRMGWREIGPVVRLAAPTGT